MSNLNDFKVVCDESNNAAEVIAHNQLHVDITLNVKQVRYDTQVADMLARLRSAGLAIKVTKKVAYIFNKNTGQIIA